MDESLAPAWLEELIPEEHRGLTPYTFSPRTDARVLLDANESPSPLPPALADELAAVLARVDLNRYPDPEALELRRALCTELGVAPDQITVGNGSYELLASLVMTFCRARPEARDGRARVLYPVPSFVGYWYAGLVPRHVGVEVPLTADFALDTAAVDHAFATTRPNVALFGMPNNPTGTQYPRAEIVRIIERNPDVLIVVDEAYYEYAGETMIDLLPAYPNMVIVRTLSKISAAGLRVGVLVASPAIIRQMETLRSAFNISAFNQAAAVWLLRNHREWMRQQVQHVVQQRDRLARELAGLAGIRVFPSRANFLLCRYGEPGSRRAGALCGQLRERGILVRSVDSPGLLDACFRVSVGTPDENTFLLDTLRELVR